MNPSLHRFRPLAVAALCALIAPAAFAVTATTDPVGFVKVDLQGNADSYSYIPFKRTPEYAGSILSVATNVLTPTGTPSFGNLVYAAGSQPKHYYVIFTTGTKTGMYYSVTNNSATTVTVDPAGDDISGVVGANFQVVPFDTLGTIFPAGQGINGSSSHSAAARQTEILIPDNATAGVDLAAAKSYYYFTGATGAGPGWRLAGVTGTLANDDILLPDAPFVVRHNVATATAVTYMGTVHMAELATPIGTIADNTNQDNAITLPIASNLTLAETKLFESGAFVGSSSHSAATRKDELLIWDNSVIGKDKASDRSYYYFTGLTGNGPGWRLAGDTSTVRNTEVVFTPTTSLALRKKSTGVASTVIWTVKPPYVP